MIYNRSLLGMLKGYGLSGDPLQAVELRIKLISDRVERALYVNAGLTDRASDSHQREQIDYTLGRALSLLNDGTSNTGIQPPYKLNMPSVMDLVDMLEERIELIDRMIEEGNPVTARHLLTGERS